MRSSSGHAPSEKTTNLRTHQLKSLILWLTDCVLCSVCDSRASVRASALMCVEALFGKLAEEYLVLLPETIPFLVRGLSPISSSFSSFAT